ncbi:hypothetical protein ACWDTG_23180 [Rhodococcus zopfii]|uniref:hypothetical protein n=1 Tax=Rhodococcus zopfii TaxID=43772 RepID=UPI00111124A1|nr:hypothetical protein [Rhodococcus zopfii]
MKPTPLLDLWQKPAGAGDPIAIVATTFTMDPDFFERDCLARFLGVESVDEGTGSADDLVARLEMEEALLAPSVTVLADRSAQAERATLRWDQLHCRVANGLLHSKVVVLIWENATRVVVGSANLTPAGYRRNIELAMAADLGPACIFPADVLAGIADEIESYLALVPGLDDSVPAGEQARSSLRLFRDRIAAQVAVPSALAVALAPTNTDTAPLDALESVWSGGVRPLSATHVSPFWDADSPAVLDAVRGLLVGRPVSDRRHSVAVTIGPAGEISFPSDHRTLVDDVVQLGPLDENTRALHAKCLILHSSRWVAVLIGSSNHTTAGLGLGGHRRHRELNVWLGAPLDGDEGKALAGLVPLGKPIDDDAPYEQESDEDEPEQLSVLPAFFQLCRVSRTGDRWELQTTFDPSDSPSTWRISLPNHQLVLDEREWREGRCAATHVSHIGAEQLPMYLDVEWDGATSTWAVLADDRHDLPPGPGLAELRSAHLLDALATGKTLAQALRDKMEREERERQAGQSGIVTDPLRRFDSQSTLLRRGRALAAALTALERRLARPVVTLDALEARLVGPLGPRFVAEKTVSDLLDGALSRPDAMFTIAEIALSVARVPWPQTLQHVDRKQGLGMVERTLDELDALRTRLGDDPVDLSDYLERAIKEAKRCLAG